MMFDNLNQSQSPRPTESRASARRRGLSRAVKPDEGGARRRSSSFEQASRLPDETRIPSDRNTAVWLWVLGILMATAFVFSWLLQGQRSSAKVIYGDAPSILLSGCIDPVLAPLATGISPCSSETLGNLGARFRADRAKANRDDQDVYATAATIADILSEAEEDRDRHLQRLQGLASSTVPTKQESPVARAKIGDTERQHLQLAVDVSWQRNSGAYRNRVEELWSRLQRLEHGRFQSSPSTQPHL